MTRVLVTGGTGVLGRELMQALRQERAEPVALSHSGRAGTVKGDLLTGDGLEEALEGVEVVVHAATSISAVQDIQMTQNLLTALAEHDIRHVLYVSIAGVDDLTFFDYYAAKLAGEQLLQRSGLPFSIQRVTQFHEFVDFLLGKLRLGQLQLAPSGVSLQSVEAAAAAEVIAQSALQEPAGRLPDLAGPRIHSMTEMAQMAGFHPLTLPIPLPVFKAMRTGKVIPAAPRIVGKDWQTWLAEHHRQPSAYVR